MAPRNRLGEARDLARRIVTDPDYLKHLIEDAQHGILEKDLQKMLWGYAFGKVPEEVRLTQVEDNFSGMSNEELASCAAELEATLRALNEQEQQGQKSEGVCH